MVNLGLAMSCEGGRGERTAALSSSEDVAVAVGEHIPALDLGDDFEANHPSNAA
jgi:hypothetical protein